MTIFVQYHRHSRPEVFCKKRALKGFQKIHSKTPVLEPLINKVAGLRPAALRKRDYSTLVFLRIL